MTSTITIYGMPTSRTRRCLWTLEEVGAEYELKKLDFSKGEHKSPDFLKINPNARVPAMTDTDGDVVLFESAAICQYIARKYESAQLLPKQNVRDEALHDQWMFWVISELEQGLWSMGKHRFALPAEHRIDKMQQTALFEWQRAVPVLANAISLSSGPYLLGEKMYLVDIMVAHTLLWARIFKVPFGHDVLEKYLDAMIARPAFAASKCFD